jgi:pimeloyl-ACP methyl ester carboxylesterase
LALNWKKLGLAAAGVAAGVAGVGVGVERLILARERRRSDPDADQPIPDLDDAIHHRIVTSTGDEIHVVERGQGPAVVLVHGITLSAEAWRFQLHDLPASGYRTVAVDLRGHGQSRGVVQGLTIERLGDDLSEVIEALDLTDAVVVGHSMGGMVVMTMLAGDPVMASGRGRVRGLVLAATSARPVARFGVPAVGALMRAVNPVASRGVTLAGHLPGGVLPPGDIAYLLTRGAFGARPSARAVELTRQLVSATPAGVVAELAVAMSLYDRRRDLGRIAMPTSVVVGARDLLTPLSHAKDLARAIPGAHLVVFPDCGHMLMLERREEFNRAIIEVAQRGSVTEPEQDPVTGQSSAAPLRNGR